MMRSRRTLARSLQLALPRWLFQQINAFKECHTMRSSSVRRRKFLPSIWHTLQVTAVTKLTIEIHLFPLTAAHHLTCILPTKHFSVLRSSNFQTKSLLISQKSSVEVRYCDWSNQSTLMVLRLFVPRVECTILILHSLTLLFTLSLSSPRFP